jgi:hypothetical protein
MLRLVICKRLPNEATTPTALGLATHATDDRAEGALCPQRRSAFIVPLRKG